MKKGGGSCEFSYFGNGSQGHCIAKVYAGQILELKSRVGSLDVLGDFVKKGGCSCDLSHFEMVTMRDYSFINFKFEILLENCMQNPIAKPPLQNCE